MNSRHVTAVAQIIVEYRHIVGQEEDECEFVSSGTIE